MGLPPMPLLAVVLLLNGTPPEPMMRPAAASAQGQGEPACMRPDPCGHRSSRPLQLGSESLSGWLGSAAAWLLLVPLLLSSRLHAAALGAAVTVAAGSPQQEEPWSRCSSRLWARRMRWGVQMQVCKMGMECAAPSTLLPTPLPSTSPAPARPLN